MDAAVWTLIAIMGAFSFGLLALIASQNSRFDAINAGIDQAVRDLRSEIRALGERMDRRLTEHEARHRP